MSRDRLVVTEDSHVYFVDRDGQGEAEVSKSLWPYGANEQTLWAAPATDLEGNVYLVACSGIYSLAADGSVRWHKENRQGCWDANGETTPPVQQYSPPVLSPRGVVFGITKDQALHALDIRDGSELWSQPMPYLDLHASGIFAAGGNEILIRSSGGVGVFAIDATSGTRLGSMQLFCSGGSAGALAWTMSVECQPGQKTFNTCQVPPVPNPTSGGGLRHDGWLVVPGERLLVVESWYDEKQGWQFGDMAVYRRNGSIAAGPIRAPGSPLLVGADGVIYTAEPTTTDGGWLAINLVAHSPDLREIWRLKIRGYTRLLREAVLDEAGVLTLAEDGHLTAVQTQSPGLAATSWPAGNRDNRGTRWLGGPVRDGQATDGGAGDSAQRPD